MFNSHFTLIQLSDGWIILYKGEELIYMNYTNFVLII